MFAAQAPRSRWEAEGGVDVADAVRVGTGEAGVSEARSGSKEAHPALKMISKKNRKTKNARHH